MFCVICMVNLRGSHVKTPCHHYFHVNCLKRIANPSCPMCRKNIISENWIVTKRDRKTSKREQRASRE